MSRTKKILFTVLKIVLHILGFPLLAGLVYLFNRQVIADGAMYGISVYVSLIVVGLMAFIYYLAYFLVRTKKSRSIRNQTVIAIIVVVCCLSGFWMLIDGVAADPLESATSSTIRWEDLSDNWEARSQVNHQLLEDYVTINYHMGRLTAPNGETIEDYIAQGPNNNEELAALLTTDFEDMDGDGFASFKGPSVDYAQSDRMTIPVLLHLFLDDRSPAQGVNSNYEKVLSIPVPYYYNPARTQALREKYEADMATMTEDEKAAYRANLPLKEGDNYVLRIYHGYGDVSDVAGKSVLKAFLVTDDDLGVVDCVSSVNVVSITDGHYCATHSQRELDESGNAYFATTTQVCKNQAEAIAYLQDTYACGDDYYVGAYRMATVGWHVLDMLGEGMQMDMSGMFSERLMDTEIAFDLGAHISLGTIGDILASDLLPDAFAIIADMLNEPELLGSPLYIGLNTATGELSLEPSNAHRGVLGYMQFAWLNSDGLLFILVSFFSVRTLFYIYGPVMVIITLLLGWIREAERNAKGDKVLATATADAGASASTEGGTNAQTTDTDAPTLDSLAVNSGEEEDDGDLTIGEDHTDTQEDGYDDADAGYNDDDLPPPPVD